MSDQHDFFTDHYCLLRRDTAARRRLIDDPIASLKEYFGSVPNGGYRIEVIPQDPDTITIVLPAPRLWANPMLPISTRPAAASTTCCSLMGLAAT